MSQLAKDVIAGQRGALAKAITLVESTKREHRVLADELLTQIMPHTGGALRIGVSGAPGVGKSTFIDAFGIHVVEQGHRLAVLAVDPSSRTTGGSILGDKTRMEALSQRQQVFIRPSPAGVTLGGVARKTRESLLLCEAAGFDVVLVETVGVGQSETAVSKMTDIFILLVLPGGGDELQGIKRGIMELTDLLLVNKADGDLLALAQTSVADYRNALRLLQQRHQNWQVPVCAVSSLHNTGIAQVWQLASELRQMLGCDDALQAQRATQAKQWMWDEAVAEVVERMRTSPATQQLLASLESKVMSGAIPASRAARDLLDAFFDKQTGNP